MSQENVEIVRRGYEVFASGRFALEFLDPEIEWRGPRQFPDLAAPRYGHDGVKEYIAEEFIDLGDDRVLVFAREGGRGKGSGLEVQTNPTAHLYTLRGGKAIRMQSYWERAEALEAVGLEE